MVICIYLAHNIQNVLKLKKSNCVTEQMVIISINRDDIILRAAATTTILEQKCLVSQNDVYYFKSFSPC